MSDELYPPESQRMDFLCHLEELRRRIFTCLIFLVAGCGVLFSQGQALLALLEKPGQGLITEFIFLTPTEVFGAYVRVVLLASFFACFPVMLYEFWAFLAPALTVKVRRRILGWFFFALACFFGGIAFSYCLVLPAALKFLIGFGEGLARPAISLAKYVSFSSAILLVGGCVFEIPVIIGLLTEAGILNAPMLRSTRRYAVLIIFIVAAVITPTQDIVNMLIFSVPMILLYEVGIGLSAIIGEKKK